MKNKSISEDIIMDINTLNQISEENLINKIKKKEILNLLGSFAFKFRIGKNYFVARDNSGSKKLFYGLNQNKKIIFSNNYLNLLTNCNKDSIFSVPRGTLLELSSDSKILSARKIRTENVKLDSFFYQKIKKKILKFMLIIKKIHGDTCYICLSGGLDSSIIAFYAKKIFRNPIIITASFLNNLNDSQNLSSDILHSRKMSKFLKLKHIEVFFQYKNIKKDLKKIMYSSQDWRDYNVHCACINYYIAKYIRRVEKKKIVPVLTGDMMNEFVADYEPEFFDNKEYYKQLDCNKKVRQRFLINGLDSSDREVGVFNYFSLPAYQPYSALIDTYKNIPLKILNNFNFKPNVNGRLIPKKLFNLVLKKKNRAQIVDGNGGILGFFIKNKMDQSFLYRFFRKQFKLNKKWQDSLFNIGMYRVQGNSKLF
jgi:asparagine synthetase B (glutamine-hydrolysing)